MIFISVLNLIGKSNKKSFIEHSSKNYTLGRFYEIGTTRGPDLMYRFYVDGREYTSGYSLDHETYTFGEPRLIIFDPEKPDKHYILPKIKVPVEVPFETNGENIIWTKVPEWTSEKEILENLESQ